MTSFWTTSDGTDLAANPQSSYSDPGGDFELIPDNTTALVAVKDVKWQQDKNFNEYVNIQWTVQEPEAIRNRVVFQKLWITDDNPNAKDPVKKRDNDRKKFIAVDSNSGGKVIRKGGKPTDEDMQINWIGKAMIAKIKTYSFTGNNGDKIEGNFIASISEKGSEELKVGNAPPKPDNRPTRDVMNDALGSDGDIPF